MGLFKYLLGIDLRHKSRKPFMATMDLGYFKRAEDETGPGVVFSSGPFKRKRFRTLEEAQAWLGDIEGSISTLTWIPQSRYKVKERATGV